MEDKRHLIGCPHVFCRDDFILLHVTEQGNLLFQFRRQIAIRPAQQDVGLDTDLPQLIDAMLCRLGLELAGCAQVGNESHVDVEDILAAHIVGNLADGFEERQALDVTDGAADFTNDHVLVAGHRPDVRFDLIRDVRDDLNGAAQIVSPTLFREDVIIDPAGCKIIAPAHGD